MSSSIRDLNNRSYQHSSSSSSSHSSSSSTQVSSSLSTTTQSAHSTALELLQKAQEKVQQKFLGRITFVWNKKAASVRQTVEMHSNFSDEKRQQLEISKNEEFASYVGTLTIEEIKKEILKQSELEEGTSLTFEEATGSKVVDFDNKLLFSEVMRNYYKAHKKDDNHVRCKQVVDVFYYTPS